MRARGVVIGIDIGTTNWKVVAYDENGQQLARVRRPVMVHEEPGGRAHYDPEEVWGFVVEGLREVARQLGPEDARRVAGIAATSMGEAGVLVDEAGQALYPAIAWFDPRTEAQGRFWREKVDPYQVYEVTGFPPQYIASVNKVMWIREHEPARFARARRWLCMADYVAFRLSGEQAMDFSLACRTMAFDIRRRAWSGELLSLAGIDPALFPLAVPSGTALGRLRAEVAEATGLPTSAVIAAGGQDHWCGALAARASWRQGTSWTELVPSFVENGVAAPETPVVEQGRANPTDGRSRRCHRITSSRRKGRSTRPAGRRFGSCDGCPRRWRSRCAASPRRRERAC